jgi:hypothetical protein
MTHARVGRWVRGSQSMMTQKSAASLNRGHRSSNGALQQPTAMQNPQWFHKKSSSALELF